MNLKQKLSQKMKKTGGFTLVEMLIVVAIIAILIAISIPMINSSLEKARQNTDAANKRAAEGAALASYMLAEDSTEFAGYFTENAAGDATCYYNADDGKVQPGKPTSGYNQAKQDDIARGEACVEVTIDADTGTAEVKWIAVSGT